MKIVFVSQPLSTGGAEKVVATLANRFDELGNEVKIVVVDNGDKNIYKTNDTVEIIHIKKPSIAIVDLIYRAIKMRTFFDEYEPDIIIPFTTQKSVSVLLASLFIILMVRRPPRSTPSIDPQNKALRLLRKVLYWTSDGFVFQTKAAKEYFSKKIQDRSIIIPNPIYDEMPLHWDGVKRPTIVMVNRLNEGKNIEMAINAMEIVVKKHPEYTLEIYGKSYPGHYEYENKLKCIILDKNMQNSVYLMGFLSDVQERIKDANIFLMTSYYEGMSNALMEAMALGIPCISTPNDGALSLITDKVNGIIIPFDDIYACASAIETLIDDNDYRDRIASQAIKIRDELSTKNVAEMWMEYIKQVIDD